MAQVMALSEKSKALIEKGDHAAAVPMYEQIYALMMEKLGEPQTHLGLKAIMKEVDEVRALNAHSFPFPFLTLCFAAWNGIPERRRPA